MPKTCACHGCTNRSSRLNNVSFHRFPHGDPDLLLKWVTSIGREDFQPTANHSVCSEHFVKKDYLQGVHPRDGPKGMSYKLLAQAVPTVITSHEPLRRPRRQKSQQKQVLLIKAECPDDEEEEEKVAFQPPKVLSESNDRSAASPHVQRPESKVTERTLHSPNTESRNQLDPVSDELRFAAASGVVKQEPKDSNEHHSQAAAREVMTDHVYRASAENMERELKETKFKLHESRKEVRILKQKLKNREDALSKLLKALKDQRIISREPTVNLSSVCSEHLLKEDCLQEVHLRDGEKGASGELLAPAVSTYQPCEQKSRRKQTLPKKRHCPDDDDDDDDDDEDIAFQSPEKINGSSDRSTASPLVHQPESKVTQQTLRVPNREAGNRLDLVSGEHGLTASSGVMEQQQSEVVLTARKVMRTLPELVSLDRCVYSNRLPKT